MRYLFRTRDGETYSSDSMIYDNVESVYLHNRFFNREPVYTLLSYKDYVNCEKIDRNYIMTIYAGDPNSPMRENINKFNIKVHIEDTHHLRELLHYIYLLNHNITQFINAQIYEIRIESLFDTHSESYLDINNLEIDQDMGYHLVEYGNYVLIYAKQWSMYYMVHNDVYDRIEGSESYWNNSMCIGLCNTYDLGNNYTLNPDRLVSTTDIHRSIYDIISISIAYGIICIGHMLCDKNYRIGITSYHHNIVVDIAKKEIVSDKVIEVLFMGDVDLDY